MIKHNSMLRSLCEVLNSLLFFIGYNNWFQMRFLIMILVWFMVSLSIPKYSMTNSGDRMVTSFCDETGEDRCEWLNLPYKINVQSIEVSIPVGNTEHTSLVVAVTTIVTCGATIYLVISMFREIKHKAE